MSEDFHKKLMAAVQERLSVIAGNEEKLVEAWVAQHGFKPDECEIVRQDMHDGTVRTWVAKRGEFAELHQLRAEVRRLRLAQRKRNAALSEYCSCPCHLDESADEPCTECCDGGHARRNESEGT